MRLLHVISKFDVGGVQNVCIDLARAFAQMGHEVGVVALMEDGDPGIAAEQRERLASAGVDVMGYRYRTTKSMALLAWPRLAGLFRRWKPDLVHSHSDLPDFAVSCAMRLKPVRLVRTIHNSTLWEGRPRVARFVESRFVDDLVIAVSRDALEAYREMRARARLPVSKSVRVIVNGVKDPETEISHSEFHDRFGGHPDIPLLCFAGRFTDQKGIDLLAEAFRLLPEGRKRTLQMHIFGRGPVDVEAMFDAAYLGENVFVHAPYHTLMRLLPVFDAVVMPSRYEGNPLVALETLIRGVPLIGTDVPGLREVMPPDWPYTVKSGDTRDLADKILMVLDDPERAQVAGNLAREWARERFALDRVIKEYAQACEDYLQYPQAA